MNTDLKYSPEGLNDFEPTQKNYTSIKFNSEEERKEALYSLCVSSGALTKDCVEKLIESGFLTAPASTRYHGCYSGGLFDHSYSVATTLKDLTKKLYLKWENPNSPVRIGILHDLCKIDQYFWDIETQSYRYKDIILISGHGIKSVVLAEKLPNVFLTQEELACILYHMGAFTDREEWKNYTNAVHMYPNVLWTHTADMYSSHVLELETEEL